MKTRVAIWAAVSSKPQAAGDKTSLSDQEHLGRQYAERIGGEVVRIYKVPGHTRDVTFWDEAASAMPAYRELREDAEAGAFDDLWVLDPDRLGRDPALSHQVASLVKKGGQRLWVEDGQYYVSEESSAGGYMFAFQSQRGGEMQRKRVMRHDSGMRGRVKRGLPPNNWPHGYRGVRDENGKVFKGEFVQGEIEAVRLATELYLAGAGIFTIAHDLDASPWKPRQSEHWSFATVRKMLHNSIYAGIVHYGEVRNPKQSDKFPAVWDEATYKEIIREHQRRKRGGTRPASPVSGCMICAREGCGWSMSSLERKGVRYFRCSRHAAYGGCHHNLIRESIIIENLEFAISKELQRPGGVEAALNQIGPGRATIEQEIGAIQAQVAAIEDKQYRLAILAEDGAIDIEAARRRTSELAEQLAAADRSLRQAQEKLTTLPDPGEMCQRLEQVAELVDLRSKPLEVVRNLLLRAGVKVYVENREIVRITFGELS